MIKKEMTDKVDHNSVQISCKNKGQMVASVHSFTSFTHSLRSLIHSSNHSLFFLRNPLTAAINYLNSSI